MLQPNDKEAEPQVPQPKSVPNGNSLKTQYGEGLNSVFKKMGHTITGWKNAKTGKPWDVDAPLTADVTLSAMWEPKTYTMTFVTPEGAPPMPGGQGTKGVVYDRTTDAPKYGTGDTAWSGHTFHGWYTDPDPEAGRAWRFSGEAGADFMPAGDVTLYADWTRGILSRWSMGTLFLRKHSKQQKRDTAWRAGIRTVSLPSHLCRIPPGAINALPG